MAHLLIIDDAFQQIEASLREVFEDHRVTGALDGRAGLNALASNPDVDVVLLDVRMPRQFSSDDASEGLAVHERIRADFPDVPVIFLSAYDDLGTVNRALTSGGMWYLKKPPDYHETRALIERAVTIVRERREARALRVATDSRVQAAADGGRRGTARSLVLGESAATRRLRAEIANVACTEVSVLLMGETGVGKEVCARELHRLSSRQQGPFLAVNCAELNSDSTAIGRLFGHTRSAFTGAAEELPGSFELAKGGTLFFDEVGELGLDLQARLLRVLQEREITRLGAGEAPRRIDVRLLFATNRDLERAMLDGKFREDFYYRIAVCPLFVPPIRERLADLDQLAPALLRRAIDAERLPRCVLGTDVLPQLRGYEWAGNVRELENVLKRAALRARNGVISAADLVIQSRAAVATPPVNTANVPVAAAAPAVDLAQPLASLEANDSQSDDSLSADGLFRRLQDEGGYRKGITAFRDEFGERVLRDLLQLGIRRCGGLVRAGELLRFVTPENRAKDYDNLRYWAKKLKVRVHDSTDGATQ